MRKIIIIGNWKMHKDSSDTIDYLNGIKEYLRDDIDVGVAINYLMLKQAKEISDRLIISAQNCYHIDAGAYTGEVSYSMLKDINIGYCLVGHSERREYFNESDHMINLKVKALLDHDMIPILCIGETKQDYENNDTYKILKNQLDIALKDIAIDKVSNIIIAYEPIWAIGTGISATKEIAQECCFNIRNYIKELYNEDISNAIRIQYGGSVNPSNIKEYMAMEDIDGALIGKASLEVSSFKDILESIR